MADLSLAVSLRDRIVLRFKSRSAIFPVCIDHKTGSRVHKTCFVQGSFFPHSVSKVRKLVRKAALASGDRIDIQRGVFRGCISLLLETI